MHIRLAAEVLDHTFTGAVTDCGHAERTTLFLTAVESQLSERVKDKRDLNSFSALTVIPILLFLTGMMTQRSNVRVK